MTSESRSKTITVNINFGKKLIMATSYCKFIAKVFNLFNVNETLINNRVSYVESYILYINIIVHKQH